MEEEIEVEEDEPKWTHEIKHFGPMGGGLITCGNKEIGWHIQYYTDAFFICGPDITIQEIESYENSLKEHKFKYAIIRGGIQEFRKFLSDKKDTLDPIFICGCDYILR